MAQACDRCRLKKIRCYGAPSGCGRCAHAGFACHTSDKLKRQSFPTGYTESLEVQIRQLTTEIHTLKQRVEEANTTTHTRVLYNQGTQANSCGETLAEHVQPQGSKGQGIEWENNGHSMPASDSESQMRGM